MPNHGNLAVKRASIALLLLIAAGIAARVICPAADPPLHRQSGATWWDEYIAHDARNAVLWGNYATDAYRSMLEAPLHVYLTRLTFEAFGVHYWSLRLPAMAGGVASLFLLYWLIRVAGGSRIASLLATAFAAISWCLIGISRTAIVESTLLPCLLLALLGVCMGESRRRIGWYAMAGVCGGLAFLTKMTAGALLLPMAAYLAFGACASASSPPSPRWRATRTCAFAIPMATVACAGYAAWVLPHYRAFQTLVLDTQAAGRLHNSLAMLGLNIPFLLESQAFLTTPALFIAVFLCLPGLISARKCAPLGHTASMQRFALGLVLATSIGGTCIYVWFDVVARRFAWATFIAAFLAACAWDTQEEHEDAPPSNHFQHILRFTCCMVSGLIAIGWAFSPNGGLLAFLTPALAAHMLYDMPIKITYKLLWLALGAGVGALVWRALRTHWESIWRNRRRMLAAALVFQGAYFAMAAGLYAARCTYTIQNASRAMANYAQPGEYVLGVDALAICFENDTRPLAWYPGILWGNRDESVLESTFKPRFLLTAAFRIPTINRSSSAYIKSFIDHPIARFPLFELNECPALKGDLVLFERDSSTADSP